MTKIPQRDGKQTAQSILAIFITRSSSFNVEEGLDFTNNLSVWWPRLLKMACIVGNLTALGIRLLWQLHLEVLCYIEWQSVFCLPFNIQSTEASQTFLCLCSGKCKAPGHRGYIFCNILYIQQNTSTPKIWFNPAFVQTFMIPRGWIQMTLLMADFSSSATMRLWFRV